MYSKNALIEVKKGEEGKGLLIENDGYISLDIKGNESLHESIGFNEDETTPMKLPNPFIVSAVFQKYGIENANGRVYPEEILKREVEKYQRAIKARSAYGECYTPDAECLTPNGWVSIVDIKEGDEIITLNTNTLKTEIQKVTYKTDKEWDGEMIHITGDCIDDTVTPDHEYPVFKIGKDIEHNIKADFFGFVSATNILKSHSSIYECDHFTYFIPCDKEPSFTKYGEFTKRIYLNSICINAEKINYSGRVYCVEVPNHTWYVRQNGKSHWTKNCNHPETSTIDLSRVAMNIIELHWEGHTLVGKIEIPITPGFRKLGIVSTCADQVAHWIISGLRVGVSSRALGSVKQVMGKLVVGDDLELICWDIVSTPSTPGAFIEVDSQKLKPYIENVEGSKDKTIIKEDKFSKFDSWLND